MPVKESKGKGAVERAVRTWQGQFRTLKDRVEYEIKSELRPRHIYKAKEPLYMSLATVHNIHYMNDLMARHRQDILEDKI